MTFCSRSYVTLKIKFIEIMLYLKLIWNIGGQTVGNHSISSNIMILAVLIPKMVIPLMIITLGGKYSTALVLVNIIL